MECLLLDLGTEIFGSLELGETSMLSEERPEGNTPPKGFRSR